MKLIRSPFLLYTLFLPLWSFAQHTASGDLNLKVYANIILEQRESEHLNLVKDTSLDATNAVSVLEFGAFTPALALYHDGGHFSEIEMAALQRKRLDHVRIGALTGPFPGKTSTFSLALRYGYHFSMLGRQGGAVRPYFGLSATPFLEINRTVPENKVLYDTRETTIGLLGQTCSRLNFFLTDYLVLDLNVLITLVELTNRSLKLESSAVNYPPDKASNSQVRWLPNRTQIRLGVGVLF
ncbi:MAG: hypothetical protein KDD01_12630 [Phaeodactylibacter sp.]|nr:hypothetical protein [Phaeodactylibacter sp.]